MRRLRRPLLTGLAFGFVVIVILLLVADVRQLRAQLDEFPLLLVPGVLAATLFNYLLRFFKWHYYLGRVGIRGLSLATSARIFVAGFPLAVTPGKVGEAMKAVWLRNETGTPVARGIPVVLAERVSDGLAMLALACLGVFAFPRYLPAFLAALGLMIAIVLVLQTRGLALRLLAYAERLPLLQRFAHDLHEFYDGAYHLFRPRANLVAVSLGVVAWAGEGLATYLVLLGLGVPAGFETFTLAVFVLALSTIVGALSALPGGLGAAEASMAGMFAFVLAMPAGQAAAATLVVRMATLWFAVGLGFIAWALWRRQLFTGAGTPQPAQTRGPEGAT